MEMANPSPALKVILRDITGPLFRDVRELVREITGPKTSEEQLELFTVSIMGQCIFYVSSRPAVEQLAVHLGRRVDRSSCISNHIATFSLAALHAFRSQGTKQPASRARRSSRIPALR